MYFMHKDRVVLFMHRIVLFCFVEVIHLYNYVFYASVGRSSEAYVYAVVIVFVCLSLCVSFCAFALKVLSVPQDRQQHW